MTREIITSRQNESVKLAVSLLRKKSREELSLFRFDGIKLLSEALSKNVGIENIFVAESAVESIVERVGEVKFTVVSDALFEKMSEEKSPEGVITVAKALDKINKIDIVNFK